MHGIIIVMKKLFRYSLVIPAVLVCPFFSSLFAQANTPQLVAVIPVNYDESKTGFFTLPDPLLLSNGKKVNTPLVWMNQRRPEIVRLFEENQFGTVPPAPAALSFNVFEKGTPVADGKMIRKQVTIFFTTDTSDHKMELLLYIPAHPVKPPPLLLNISFTANNLSVDDPGIKQGKIWKDGKKIPALTAAFRKTDVQQFIDAGIAYATVYYGDIEPDFKGGFNYGIRGVYRDAGENYTWGAVAAWSWGLSRAMDYLQTDKDIDATQIAVTGASRLGKTVLWTGARDTRFAMVIASISGESGAALSRRNYGETVAHMTDTARYFYQFTPHYHDFANRVDELPVDGHMLISLIAPRPLLLQTGSTDKWSDPKGEYLAAQAAGPVYALFGKQGVGEGAFPEPGDESMLNTLGYYMHEGGHTVLPGDYRIFIRFIQSMFK